MIYITGDTHGSIDRFYGLNYTSEDKVIVCGDFGFIWEQEYRQSRYERELEKLDFLESQPYEILFVSGNHENYDRLKQFPQVKRYGGDVLQIRKNIFLLKRGQVFTIENHTFFTMGGAYSVDKDARIEHLSWWSEELPSQKEYQRAIQTLNQHESIDFIITHTAPQTIIRMMHFCPYKEDEELTGFFDWILYEKPFKYWFFGHFHTNDKIKDVNHVIPVYTHTYRINQDKSITYLGGKDEEIL